MQENQERQETHSDSSFVW